MRGEDWGNPVNRLVVEYGGNPHRFPRAGERKIDEKESEVGFYFIFSFCFLIEING